MPPKQPLTKQNDPPKQSQAKQVEAPKPVEQSTPAQLQFENIKVAVRVRPLNERELTVSDFETVRVLEQKNVLLINPAKELGIELETMKQRAQETQFMFTYAFDKISAQKVVYDASCSESVDKLLKGYNVALCSYGATGSGKSYTMVNNQENPGITTRALNQIFTTIEKLSLKEATTSVSFIQIHNEQLRDLLQKDQPDLDIREDPVKGIIINNVLEKTVRSTTEVLALMKSAQRNKEATTKAHDILTLTVEVKEKNSGAQEKINISKLQIIDLGGSERGAGKGTKINTSLTVLGNCIQSLYEGQEKGLTFIPYRNSKLTRLMKESLGGNCKTVIIACISPAVTAYEETLSTLIYAQRAVHIQNYNKQNVLTQIQPMANYSQLIEKLKNENEDLKKIVSNNSALMPEISKASEHQLVVQNFEGRIKAHFQTEKELKQQVFMLEGEFTKISLRQEDLQDSLERIEGFDTSEAKTIREQIDLDTRMLKDMRSKMDQQEKEFKAQLDYRNKLYADISSSKLPPINQNYLVSLMKAGVLSIENMDIKQSELRNNLIKQQQDKQLEILRSQLKLRDDIIEDQKKYLSVHAKLNHFSQIKTTQEIIRDSKAILVHYPIPENKNHSYFNRQAYAAQKQQLDEFHQTKFDNIRKQLATPKKQDSTKGFHRQSIKSYVSNPQLPPINKIHYSNISNVYNLSILNTPPREVKKTEHTLPVINDNRDRDLSKFEYDWQHGGYHLKEDQRVTTSRKAKYLKRKRFHNDNDLSESQLKNLDKFKVKNPVNESPYRSTQRSFYDFRSNHVPQQRPNSGLNRTHESPVPSGQEILKQDHRILLPGQVQESPYVKNFIKEGERRKERLLKLNQHLKELRDKEPAAPQKQEPQVTYSTQISKKQMSKSQLQPVNSQPQSSKQPMQNLSQVQPAKQKK